MQLRKQGRLLQEDEFSAVFEAAHSKGGGRILHKKPYVIYLRLDDDAPRLGISISRKVVRHAHERNRIRRVLKEFYRTNKEKFKGDLIIRLVSRPDSLDYDVLTAPIVELEPKLK